MTRPIACVFARRPEAGRTKTRLARAVGAAAAARLAQAFLDDTLLALAPLPLMRVLAATEPFEHPGADEVWLQGDGELGARLERVLQRALERSPRAVALGADAVGLPTAAVLDALARLDTADVVFGPAADGGFWLLAVRTCPAGLFDGVPWSAPTTLAAAEAAARARCLTCARVAEWFDVDLGADLVKLEALLRAGRVHAPATARVLTKASP